MAKAEMLSERVVRIQAVGVKDRDSVREPVVVTKRGRPVVAVMPLTKHDDWESVSLSTNPKFMAIIERSRASARTQGSLSLEEVRRKYGLPAKTARRRCAR